MNIALNFQKNKLRSIKKIVSKFLLFSFLMISAFIFSANKSDYFTEISTDPSSNILYISNGATLHGNESVFVLKVDQNSEISQGIYISEGAFVYNDSIKNVKITKLVPKKQKTFAKEIEEKEKTLVVTKNKLAPNAVSLFHFNAVENTTTFSQSETRKIVFTQNRTEYLSKSTASTFFVYTKEFLLEDQKQITSYQNPSIKICCFSGKYSVRPPTFFS